MKFSLDFKFEAGDSVLDSESLVKDIERHRKSLSDIASLEGRIVVLIDGKDTCGEFSDPVVRLADQWLRKLPWIIGGDTETVALRNSEHCFAFVPAAESVEVSYFLGDETEVEDYVLEPTTLRLETFVTESIRIGEGLVAVLNALDPKLIQSNEDCKDLATSLTEAKRAWREHQLHQRR